MQRGNIKLKQGNLDDAQEDFEFVVSLLTCISHISHQSHLPVTLLIYGYLLPLYW